MIKRISQIIIFFFFGVHIVNGQKVIPINDFLATARTQQDILLGERTSEYLSNTNYKLPLVERLEIRIETHDFDISKQEWALRLIPNAINHRKYQKQYHKSTILRDDLDQKMTLNDALFERYLILNEYIHIYGLNKVNNDLKNLYQEKLEILKNSIDQPGFDIIDLVTAEEKLFEHEWELIDLEGSLDVIMNQIGQQSNGNDSILIDQSKLITPEHIETLLNSVQIQQSFVSLMLTQQQARIDQIQMEYNLERAKANRILGFVQAKYWGWNNELFNEAISLGLELRIPMKGEARLDLNELELEQIEEENEYQILEYKINLKQQETEDKLYHLLKQYQMVVHQNKEGYATKLIGRDNISEVVSPMDIIKMQEMILERELIIEKLKYRIFLSYIDWLDYTGKISEEPLKNHFYKVPEPF